MKENKEYTLLDYEFSKGNKKLKLVLTYFRGTPKIDIREYYLDRNDMIFKHSKKGIQLDAQKAEALRSALEQNALIIDKHLINADLDQWLKQIKKIETYSDFFSHYEFYKTKSTGSQELVIFNSNHPFGKRIIDLKKMIAGNGAATEIMNLMLILLLSYNNALCQFDEETKITVGDFIQDQHQTWSSLLKRMIDSDGNNNEF